MMKPGHPLYVCPFHGVALRNGAGLARCPRCHLSFPIETNIWQLDVVQRGDRHSFDQSASGVVRLTPEHIAAGQNKAAGMLDRAGVEHLSEAVVLDLGSGFGDLTYGFASSPRVRGCHLYAVDHSMESLSVLSRSALPPNDNHIYLSTQDASALCFPEDSFNLVVASAVLHHILDYRALLASVYRILKPSGKAVFTEPFWNGYVLATLFLSISVEQLGLTERDLKRPEFGLCSFIIEDTSYRVQHEGDLPALDKLTDKHYFREGSLAETGYDIGFRNIRFLNYEPPEFYDHFIGHFLQVYGIRHTELVTRAEELYRVFAKLMGKVLPAAMSHFKYIVLTK